jgi:hypothetical protein
VGECSVSGRIPLLKAAQDARLLGSMFAWRPAQLELLGTLDGPAQLHLWALARQSGKSSMAAAAATDNAALSPELDDVVPHGKWRTVPVIAPSESQAKDFAAVCAALTESSSALADYAEIRVGEVLFRLPRVDEHGRKFTAKTVIRAMPASAPSIRGLTAALVVLEEMAHMADSGGPADERRIWDAVGPMQTVFGSRAKVLGISTPYGESGLFAELFKQITAGMLPHGHAVRRTIEEMVPDIDADWLQARRLELGEAAYRQEFEAAFVAGGGSFFDLRGLELDGAPARPADCVSWTCGMDPAFFSDSYGCALVGRAVGDEGLLRVGDLFAVNPADLRPRSIEARRQREDVVLATVWERIEPYVGHGLRIVTDQHQASAVESYFGRRGVEVVVVNLTGPKQTEAFVSLRARLQDGSLAMWDDAATLEELRRVRAGSNTESIVLPRFGASHCDIASALSLAVHEYRESAGQVFASQTTDPRRRLSEDDGETEAYGVYSGYSDSPIDSWGDDNW